MVYRSSFSQHWKYLNHPRYWFYEKVLKVPAVSDMCYAYGGSVLHNTLEKQYNNEFADMDAAKVFFNSEWSKYKLETTKISHKKDEYWLMFVNGVNLEKHITTTELKIFYPDVVGYVDGVNSRDDELYDWKSSTRSSHNEEEYSYQLKYYSWLYFRKFGKLPTKCAVYYLKYNGSKGSLEFVPTMKDVEDIEAEHNSVIGEMEELQKSRKLPDKCSTCNFFCPYNDICERDETGELSYTLHIKNGYVFVEGGMNVLNQQLVKKFSYDLKNAHFMTRNNPYAITRIEFWSTKTKRLPIGFLTGLLKTLNDYAEYKGTSLNLKYVDHRVFNETEVPMPDKFVNGRELRDYQVEAVDTYIKNKIGLLEIGTGGGKTEIAIECIRRLGMKTIFIVDKIELLKQTKKRIEDTLGIDVGMLGAGESDIKNVTVATVQTLKKSVKQYANYLADVRFAIFDECHKVAAKSYQLIGKYLCNAEYILGASGTAKRDDGHDLAINSVVGMKVFDLGSKKLIENGWLMRPDITFVNNILDNDEIHAKEDNCKTGLINETKDYATYYQEFIVNNEKRNNIVLDLTKKHEGKKILIVVKLVEHGNMLQKLIPGSIYLHGSISKKERETIFNDFVSGKVQVLISTISIFAEGIDIPTLDVVINAAANKGDVKSIQVLGRVLRKSDSKEKALYYDFFDDGGFFTMASMSRRKAFIKEGHFVNTIMASEVKE